MMLGVYIAIIVVCGYFIGNVNFARILSWHLAKKDITTEGSKNPGTMNMLRTQGFGRAMLTLLCDALKLGAPALACYFIFQKYYPGYEDVAYFVYAFACIVGHCFPVVYRFKGGKGVACTFGMFLFHPTFWWVALALFAVCFVLFFFIPYGSLINLSYIFLMNIYATVMLVLVQRVLVWAPLMVILWLNFLLVMFMHRGNIKRLINGTENKVNFKQKVLEEFNKKRTVKKPKNKQEQQNTEISKQQEKQQSDDNQIEKETVTIENADSEKDMPENIDKQESGKKDE